MRQSPLEVAIRHVTLGRRIVAAQERRVAVLRADGCDCRAAESLLATYRQTQAIFEDDLVSKKLEARDRWGIPNASPFPLRQSPVLDADLKSSAQS